MAFAKKSIPKKSEDLADWYNKVILAAELADYGPAKGTMIFRPYGFAIWETIQREMDERIKGRGVENAYFPMFIPESLLNKEKAHVKGFSPELAVVTIGGGEELAEKLVIRPTSETIMYDTFSRWIHSWRDLPLQINQWNNVVRWEKRTYMFLRTSEFLWQEGHTAHAKHEEAQDTQRWAMDMYREIYEQYFAMPGYVGKKSESEKFAGADATLSYETLMPGGKALQSCTSHDLGQNFSKPFNITFQDESGNAAHVWQTSWGLSTRSIGGLIMVHGDDQGLRLPPQLAPIQVVIILVKEDESLQQFGQSLADQLRQKGIRVHVDSRGNESFGFKINKWELKGVPLRIEIGPKELKESVVTVARRDTMEKEKTALNDLEQRVPELLQLIQNNLYQQATLFLQQNTRDAASYDEFKKIMENERGFIRAFWCEDSACEAKIKEETKASTRCLPLDSAQETGTCIRCDKPALYKWLFAQSY